MLPRKCIHPPCRNIDVNTELHAKSAGTTPVLAHEERELAIAECLLEEEGKRIQTDDPHDECGKGPGGDDVPERDHGELSIATASNPESGFCSSGQ